MKSIIIYYSVSGNTRKVAHAVHKGLTGVLGQCDIVAIKGTSGVPGMHMGRLLEYDLIGIGSPAWNSGLPPNVERFLNDFPSLHKTKLYNTGRRKKPIPTNKRKHFFIFMTHGMHPGDAMKRAWAAARKNELTVIGWDDWYGAAFGPWMGKPHSAEGHPDDIDIKEAEEFGRVIAERSRRIYQGETQLIPKLPTGADYIRDQGGRPKRKDVPKWLHENYKVTIDMNKCTKCGLCVEHCTMDAIDLDATPPVLANCVWNCDVCEMVCPVGAVDCDIERIKEDRAGSKGESTVVKNLRSVLVDPFIYNRWPEKQLRALVPPEDEGKYGFCCDHTGHPRIVIPEQAWKDRAAPKPYNPSVLWKTDK
jgi:ferredoxin